MINIQNLKKDMKLNSQQTQQTPSRKTQNRSRLNHINIKWSKYKHKGWIIKAEGEKQLVTYIES